MKHTYIHPATPPKLVRKFKAAGYKFHRLASEINVNVVHVHSLINKGTEPTDRTEQGRETRVRMHLPRHKRQNGTPRRPQTPMQKAIRRMAKETRQAIICNVDKTKVRQK